MDRAKKERDKFEREYRTVGVVQGNKNPRVDDS